MTVNCGAQKGFEYQPAPGTKINTATRFVDGLAFRTFPPRLAVVPNAGTSVSSIEGAVCALEAPTTMSTIVRWVSRPPMNESCAVTTDYNNPPPNAQPFALQRSWPRTLRGGKSGKMAGGWLSILSDAGASPAGRS